MFSIPCYLLWYCVVANGAAPPLLKAAGMAANVLSCITAATDIQQKCPCRRYRYHLARDIEIQGAVANTRQTMPGASTLKKNGKLFLRTAKQAPASFRRGVTKNGVTALNQLEESG
ncbi:hypothetical protein [Halopseudomonas salegens]|uniref:hypothetical protein n=1 Tax=Halopseudomonas salegens TaxID=1434072 RepID=UPI0012FD1B33|nr:hypothetical protein [Halopseudomonas salegens]